MNKLGLCLLLLLAACAGYKPTVMEFPYGERQYDVDRKSCLKQGYDRVTESEPSNVDVAKFGALGMVADSFVNDQNDDYHKPPSHFADKCMMDKGYKLSN